MKTIQEYINESLLDLDDIEISVNDVRESVEKFLKENYRGKFIISDQPNKEGKFEVSGDIIYTNNYFIKYLTNDLFEFNKCKRFNCISCDSLKSLEGAPKEVNDFNCSHCRLLKSLEGAPKEVSGEFTCFGCDSLKSLKGAPKKVGGHFNCSYCRSLASLEDAPHEVGGNFYCSHCKKFFTGNDVKKYSKVKRNIYI